MKTFFYALIAALLFCSVQIWAQCPDATFTPQVYVVTVNSNPDCILTVNYCTRITPSGQLEIFVGRIDVTSQPGAPCESQSPMSILLGGYMEALFDDASSKSGFDILPCPSQTRILRITVKGCRTPDITYWIANDPSGFHKKKTSFRCSSDFRCWQEWSACYSIGEGPFGGTYRMNYYTYLGTYTDGIPCQNETFTYNPINPDMPPDNENSATVDCIPDTCP